MFPAKGTITRMTFTFCKAHADFRTSSFTLTQAVAITWMDLTTTPTMVAARGGAAVKAFQIRRTIIRTTTAAVVEALEH